MDPKTGGFSRDLGRAVQLNLGASASGAYEYCLGHHAATVEHGGKFRN